MSQRQIEDLKGNVLCKPEFGDDPRGLGNVSSELKRMLIDPGGINDQAVKKDLTKHFEVGSKLMKDTYEVALSAVGSIQPERYRNLKPPVTSPNMKL